MLAFFTLLFIGILIYHYFYGHFFTPQKNGFDGEKKHWHEYIDRIYYINLDSREDRKTQFLEEMRRMAVPAEKITRISAVNKPGQGDWGCSLSHLITIQQFIDEGLDNCIVFEDDFVFTRSLQDINAGFREVFGGDHGPFDIIMLSANEIHTEESGRPHLKRVKEAQTASGYMVNKSYAPILLQNYREGAKLIEESYGAGKSDTLQGPFCIDQYWKRLQPQSNWFVFSPKLGVQRESHSDIQGGVVNPGV
jgi:hypothetical protein